MKTRMIVRFALFLAAAPLAAGMTYDFRSVTTGSSAITLAGTASVEGKNVRLDFESGDNLIFKSNTVLVSKDGGKNFQVLDPATKSYYDFSLEELLTTAGNILKAVGGMVQMSVVNQKVNARDAGEGETIEGYPTRKQVVTSSYELSMKIMGMTTSSRVESNTEIWYTTKIPPDYITFVQHKALRSGFEDLDKLIEAQTATVKGFPLKQITTMKSTSGKQSETAVTTTTISNIKTQSIPDSAFAIPAGYQKNEAPPLGMPKIE